VKHATFKMYITLLLYAIAISSICLSAT